MEKIINEVSNLLETIQKNDDFTCNMGIYELGDFLSKMDVILDTISFKLQADKSLPNNLRRYYSLFQSLSNEIYDVCKAIGYYTNEN